MDLSHLAQEIHTYQAEIVLIEAADSALSMAIIGYTYKDYQEIQLIHHKVLIQHLVVMMRLNIR